MNDKMQIYVYIYIRDVARDCPDAMEAYDVCGGLTRSLLQDVLLVAAVLITHWSDDARQSSLFNQQNCPRRSISCAVRFLFVPLEWNDGSNIELCQNRVNVFESGIDGVWMVFIHYYFFIKLLCCKYRVFEF